MEQLLQYVWKHKIFPLRELYTTDGMKVEIINPGLHNHDAGPDFLEAKVIIGGITWIGNIEIHLSTSDWFRHHHDTDPAYANIVLHVVENADMPLEADGRTVPQLEIPIPDYIRQNYSALQLADCFPRCARIIPEQSRLRISSWLAALQIERLELRTRQIMERRKASGMNWEDTLFITVARSFGFGKNGDAFERWAYNIPLSAAAKHRDDLFQIRALFFGQAGLLQDDFRHYFHQTNDEEFRRLQSEYNYLSHKFTLKPCEPSIWKFARLRPGNFPHVRIQQLAELYFSGTLCMGSLTSSEISIKSLHSLFGKSVPASSLNLLVINSIAPMLFTYGRYKADETMQEAALQLLEQIPAENNRYTRAWKQAGIVCSNAADSQALLQLSHAYCETHDCLRCRFGYEYIRRTPDFLHEEDV